MKGLIVATLLLCTLGCATDESLVRDVNKVEVPKPVREKCVAAADIPLIPKTHMPKAGTGDTVQKNAGAVADLIELDTYARKADDILRQCAAPLKE